MNSQTAPFSRAARCFLLSALAFLTLYFATPQAKAQDTVTGAFEGTVRNDQGAPIAGASIQFINQLTGVPIARRSDAEGRFYQGLLPPGVYTIRVSAQGYRTQEVELRLVATLKNQVVPVPVILSPETTAVTTPTPTPTGSPVPTASPTQSPAATQANAGNVAPESPNILSEINTTDARRGGAFTDEEVSTLPLGSKTLTRTFDDLALLLPGVAAPPQTVGNGTGPGIGAGVGTSGQFAVNGLRSRANNFTVDGSDNNDEDIGVRRQGFFALVPQPVESIQEFQVITLLAPAQFGRNIGAQVNAVSKSGGNAMHGTIFGFFNSSQLNAPNAFDSTGGSAAATPLKVGSQSVISCTTNANCLAGIGAPITTRNPSSSTEDSFTLGQGGFVLGGPLVPNRMFYFISAEGQNLNAN
ncbi:MAG: carboxypeptidase regulatory-like domain-containing protein, partial [Acidobacteria bacterium]|nr:carboxypeptidase regulatory-like domain-containing protein [Acidobacteriota bacterium]